MPVKPPRLGRCGSCRRPAGRWRRRAGPARRRAHGRRSSGGTGGAAWRARARPSRGGAARDLLLGLADGPAAHDGGLAQRLERRRAPSANGRRRVRKVSSSPEADCRFWSTGVCASVRSPEAVHVGLELGEEGGQLMEGRRQLVRREAEISAVSAGLAHEAAHVLLAVLERADHGVGVADEALDRGRLAAQDLERLGSSRAAPDGRAAGRRSGRPGARPGRRRARR